MPYCNEIEALDKINIGLKIQCLCQTDKDMKRNWIESIFCTMYICVDHLLRMKLQNLNVKLWLAADNQSLTQIPVNVSKRLKCSLGWHVLILSES